MKHYTASVIKQDIFGKVYEVYNIFKDFFGGNFVDLQGVPSNEEIDVFLGDRVSFCGLCGEGTEWDIREAMEEEIYDSIWSYWCPFILVWWPSVKVTNEHGKSVMIQDLFAKIELDREGTIPVQKHGFLLNRSTYTESQFLSGYMHSHISSIPVYDFREFRSPCLGTGPIRETITTLKTGFDESMWMLFCQELATYVTVESISGVPYHYLERIGSGRTSLDVKDYDYKKHSEINAYSKPESWVPDYTTRDFMSYYLEHGHLLFGFMGGEFVPGMSYYRFMLDISNSLIDYLNSLEGFNESMRQRLYDCELLSYRVPDGRQFLYPDRNLSTNLRSMETARGQLVCTFKGVERRVSIIDTSENRDNHVTLVSHTYAMYLLNRILSTVNSKFKNKYERRNQGTEGSESCENVRYL